MTKIGRVFSEYLASSCVPAHTYTAFSLSAILIPECLVHDRRSYHVAFSFQSLLICDPHDRNGPGDIPQ